MTSSPSEAENTPVTSPAIESGAVETAGPQASQKGEWQGAFSTYRSVFTQILRNPQPLLAICATYVLLNIVSTLVSGEWNYFDNDGTSSYLPDLTWIIFLVPLQLYALAVADKRTVTVSELFRFDGRTFFYTLVAGIIVSLVVGLSALLLLVPLIWTIAWFAFTAFPVVERTETPTNAMEESKRLAFDHKGKVWRVIGATIFIAIPALLLALIPMIGVFGLAVLQVAVTCAFAVLYRWLQANAGTPAKQVATAATSPQPVSVRSPQA